MTRHNHDTSSPPDRPATDPLEDVAASAHQLAVAHQKRDQAIRDAHHAGKPVVHIAHAAGVTRQTVYNIIGRR